MVKKGVNVALSEELLTLIDQRRGLVSRSAYVEDLIRRALGQSKPPSPVQVQVIGRPAPPRSQRPEGRIAF